MTEGDATSIPVGKLVDWLVRFYTSHGLSCTQADPDTYRYRHDRPISVFCQTSGASSFRRFSREPRKPERPCPRT